MSEESKALYETVLLEHIKERRSERRWRYGSKIVMLLFVVFLFSFMQTPKAPTVETADHGPHVALIKIEGSIGGDQTSQGSVNTEAVIDLIRRAFENEQAQVIALSIDSPGGAPADAERIGRYLQKMHLKYPKKSVKSFIQGFGASAAYWIAASAEEVYALDTSMVGSIGAVMPIIHAEELAKKIGVDLEMMSTGPYKSLGSPTRALTSDERKIRQIYLKDLFEVFKKHVIAMRGERLHTDTPDLFSGRVWLGQEAQAIGLVDGVVSMETFFSENMPDLPVVEYQAPMNWTHLLKRLQGQAAASLAQASLSVLSEATKDQIS